MGATLSKDGVSGRKSGISLETPRKCSRSKFSKSWLRYGWKSPSPGKQRRFDFVIDRPELVMSHVICLGQLNFVAAKDRISQSLLFCRTAPLIHLKVGFRRFVHSSSKQVRRPHFWEILLQTPRLKCSISNVGRGCALSLFVFALGVFRGNMVRVNKTHGSQL